MIIKEYTIAAILAIVPVVGGEDGCGPIIGGSCKYTPEKPDSGPQPSRSDRDPPRLPDDEPPPRPAD